jgi:enoyl-CoA hydratase
MYFRRYLAGSYAYCMFWSVSRRDGLAVATFNRPPRNMMSFAAMSELETLVSEIAADVKVSVLVLTGGVAGYFIGHADLEDLAALGRGQPVDGDPGSWFRTLRLLESMPQPVVAAINGQAWGGGCEVCLACTLRVMAASAHVAQPEINVGIIPGSGGTQRLPRLIGPGPAAELILTGRTMRAQEALDRGFAQSVLPDESFLDEVLKWVGTIAAKPRAALLAAKQAMVQGTQLPLGEGLRLESRLFMECQGREEATVLEEAASARYAAAAPDERLEL